MVNPPIETLVFRVTAEAGDWALLIQTCATPLGTTPVLQLPATLQFPDAPPIQMESPGAQPEAPAGENFAVTAWLELMVRTHGPVPEHAPVHPKKIEPAGAVAVNVTEAPEL